jgi:hypothetical protein
MATSGNAAIKILWEDLSNGMANRFTDGFLGFQNKRSTKAGVMFDEGQKTTSAPLRPMLGYIAG